MLCVTPGTAIIYPRTYNCTSEFSNKYTSIFCLEKYTLHDILWDVRPWLRHWPWPSPCSPRPWTSRPEWQTGRMPNAGGPNPERSTSRNQTKISVVVTVWHICVQELGMTERYKSDVDYYCRHCCDISSYGCANLIEILTEHM